jgi:hypothetical protein
MHAKRDCALIAKCSCHTCYPSHLLRHRAPIRTPQAPATQSDSRHRHYIQVSTSAYSVGCQFQKMSGKRWTGFAFKAQSEARRHSSSKGAAPPYQRRKTARELRSGARGALPTCSSRLLLELDCEVVLEIKICSVNKGYVLRAGHGLESVSPSPPLPSSTVPVQAL